MFTIFSVIILFLSNFGNAAQLEPRCFDLAKQIGSLLNGHSFVSMKDIIIANQYVGYTLILDTPGIPGLEARSNLKVIDHHGAYRDPERPNRNTTSKLIDLYEETADQNPDLSPERIKNLMLAKIFEVTESEIVSQGVKVTTDNLGDAITSMYILKHPEVLATKDKRSFLRLVTFHEDFGTFGFRTRKISENSRQMQEAVELGDAIMAIEDKIILKYRGVDPQIFLGSDRFGLSSSETQQRAVQETLEKVHEAFTDLKIRRRLANNFSNEIQNTVAKIQVGAEKKESPYFARVKKVVGTRFDIFNNSVAVFNMVNLPSGGHFKNISAVTMGLDMPYQLRITEISSGKFSYVLCIPHGRRGFGLIDQDLVNRIKSVGGGMGFMMRDSGLLFNFAGDSLTPDQLLEVLAQKLNSLNL